MRKKRFLITLSVIAVVLAAVAALTALCWPGLNRLYRRHFMDAADYLKFVQQEALKNDSAMDMMGTFYDLTLDGAATLTTPMEHTVAIRGSDGLMSLLKTVDETNNTDLSWMEKAELKVTTGADGLNLGADMKLSVGEHQILSAGVFLDTLGGKLYAGLPDVNKTYLTTKLETEGMASALALITAAGKDGSLPDSEALEQLLYKYMTLLTEQYTNVQKTTQKVTIDKISKKCTVLSVELTPEQVNGLLVAILEDARTDATAKAFLQAWCDGLNELAKQTDDQGEALTVDTLIDGMLEKLQNAQTQAPGLVIKTYVTNTEEICGYRVETARGETVFEQLSLTKKKTWESVTRLSGGIEIRGKGDLIANKLSGTFDINRDRQNYLQCKLQSLDMEALKTGMLRGKVSLTFSKVLTEQILADLLDPSVAKLAGMALPTLEFSFEEAATKIRVLMAGKEYLNLSVTSAPAEGYTPQEPEKWVTANLQGLAKWLSDSSFNAVMDVMKKAKIPESLVTGLDKLISKWKFLAQFV